MNKLIVLGALVLTVAVSSPVYAGGQQEKMKGCNKEAKAAGYKKDERKAFMSKCLKKDYVLKADGGVTAPAAAPAVAAPVAASATAPQQDKMKTCNANATTKGLQGEARKTFINTCLKG